MMTEHKRKIACILLALLSVASFALDNPPPPPEIEPLPIDGGVLIGAFVALFYGVKKLLKNN